MTEVETELYRHYDAEGKLLYVGISLSAVYRLIEHKASRWFGRIAHIKIERHPTREAAMEAERAAIIAEKPECNIVHRFARVSRPLQPSREFTTVAGGRARVVSCPRCGGEYLAGTNCLHYAAFVQSCSEAA